MLKRELKINLKSLAVWSFIITIVFIISFLVYPSIINQSSELDKLVNTLPKEVLEIFNMEY